MTRPALPRTCANCCAYENGECWNLVTFRHGDGPYEHPKPTDVCPDHKTWDEDRAEDDAISRFRTSLGLPPRRPIE